MTALVSDAGRSRYLADQLSRALEHTAVLPVLYTRVLLPPAVVRELRDAEAPEPVRAWTANPPTWCEVRRPAPQVGTERLGKSGGAQAA